MPRTSRAEKSLKSCNEDRISALPDDVLRHVLGFLPADEAVRTCLLARRWRYLWKSMRRLRINKIGRWGSSSGVFLTKFVSCMLLLRDPGSTLDEVEIEYERHFDDDHTWTSTWIHHALSCQAQVLTVKFPLHQFLVCYLDGPPLVSRYLRRLQVSDVTLKSNFLKFSSCSALEYLKIKDSNLETVSSVLSQSLKHLSIEDCYLKNDGRIRISVPNLVSLQLISCGGRVPLLEGMLSLETAVVRPQVCWKDCCLEGVAEGCCGTCANCCGNDDHNGGCILFGGLSRAKNLELTADPEMFIFRRDLRWCPTFSRLKTLLLSEWCVQPDLHALVCMLEHSPVLENLTLQLCEQEKTIYGMEVEENPGLMEKPAAISGYLKTIEVKCEEVDNRVCKVLKFLSTFGIAITIQRTNR
ncbi:FBD-associated F-box protein At5g56370-like [Triticum dicoccoides]|uniref:FBD-associated F-box protein At5g56370-like n=1 Tax=Triticum dicoccoides TaxID=85692 RepID=UPI001891799A|nr:FBD-associated F-box protein At5g56370-like [Triticum dicoccoides]